MKRIAIILSSSVLLLGACSHYSEELSSLDETMTNAPKTEMAMAMSAPQNTMPAAGGVMGDVQMASAPAITSLPQNLAQEYYAMAKFENEQAYDYKAAKNFTQKAMMASNGQMVMPSKLSFYDVPQERMAELETARAALVAALTNENTPDNAQNLAIAQARFECWLDRAEEGKDETHYSACKNEFEESMAMLVAPAAGSPQMVDMTFAANTVNLEPVSAQNMAVMEGFLKNPLNANYKIQLMGVVPQSQGEYGTNLATSRVQSLQNMLISKGIAPNRIVAGLSPVAQEQQNVGIVQVMMIAPTAQAPTAQAPSAQAPTAQAMPN